MPLRHLVASDNPLASVWTAALVRPHLVLGAPPVVMQSLEEVHHQWTGQEEQAHLGTGLKITPAKHPNIGINRKSIS